MPRPAQANAELRKWKRNGNDFEGYVFNSVSDVFNDGDHHTVGAGTYKRIIEYGDYYLLHTHAFVFFLDKNEEVK